MDTAMAGLSHKPKLPKGMKDMRHHGIARTMIEHHMDGSHQISHDYVKPGIERTTHGASDLDGLHEHMEEHLHGPMSEEEMHGEDE